MSLHYLVDGYNVLKQLENLTHRSLRDGREGLIRFIRNHRPQGKNEITLIFDGRSEVLNPQKINEDIRVIFAKDISADEKIGQMVERSANPKTIVVVTDDKQIKYFVRPLGAKVISVKEFIGKSTVAKRKVPLSKVSLSPEVADRITKELGRIWMKN